MALILGENLMHDIRVVAPLTAMEQQDVPWLPCGLRSDDSPHSLEGSLVGKMPSRAHDAPFEEQRSAAATAWAGRSCFRSPAGPMAGEAVHQVASGTAAPNPSRSPTGPTLISTKEAAGPLLVEVQIEPL